MNSHHGRKIRSERGVALLIAIFALLLISGVAISLMQMSATESALTANYRRNVSAFFAAQAGLEEARERLVPCAPDTLWPATACAEPPVSNDPLFNFNPASVIGQVLYITNAGPTDPPFDPRNNAAGQYYDFQYLQEFGETATQAGARVVPASQMMTGALPGLPPLNYKWVRINLKSENMGGIDLNGDGIADPIQAVRAQSSDAQCLPGMPACSANANAVITVAPVYRVTAMSIDPSGAERMVQAEMAMPPIFNPNGAISSKAGVSINGNFNAFGSWPPIVQEKCGSGKAQAVIPTCGSFQGGKTVGDCNQPYDPKTDTCAGVPRSHKDYCNQGDAVNGVSSAGNIVASAGYDQVPDANSACDPQGVGCVSTVSPQQSLSPNTPNWPYDMDQIIELYRPPATEPATNVQGISCGTYDTSGNRTCKGQGVKIGTLPSPWPVPAGTTSTNNTPRLVFAETGKGGLLKLTGASSGSGVLVIEGDAEIQAGFQWYGLVIVRGVLTFTGGGATSTNIIGGVLAGSSVTNASTTTGGSVSVTYSSCAYRSSITEQPLRYLGFREVPRP